MGHQYGIFTPNWITFQLGLPQQIRVPRLQLWPYYWSRNNDLSLVSGICISAICIMAPHPAQPYLRGRGWTNFSPLFNDWDDAGPPPTGTPRLWVTWDVYEWDLLCHREAVLSGLGTSWVVLVFWLGFGLLCFVFVLFWRYLAFCSHLFSNMRE